MRRLITNFWILCSLLFVSFLSPTTTHAAGIVVDTSADTFDVGFGKDCSNVVISDLPGTGDLSTSLREAVCAANNTPGADQILFADDYTITLGSPLPAITDRLMIYGEGRSITISGDDSFRILYIDPGTIVELYYLTITHGNIDTAADNHGGAVYNENGTLNIVGCAFVDNVAEATVGDPFSSMGGAIFNNDGLVTVELSYFSGNNTAYGGGAIASIYGSLTVDSSHFEGNQGFWYGGAIASADSVSTVAHSTFVDNTSVYGGAIANVGETLTVSNSTFHANEAHIGGGIYNDAGILILLNSTLAGNIAHSEGGGVYNAATDPGGFHYANTIIAGSTGGDCVNTGDLVTNINNLVQDGSCGAALSGDPNLGPLADNGGPTQTMALIDPSPAIDAGNLTVCQEAPVSGVDQRGETRPSPPGGDCDIGAYEWIDSTAPMITITDVQPFYLTGPTSFTITFDEDVSTAGGSAGADSATNPDNYLLLEEGALAGFQTLTCSNPDLVNDTKITIDSVSYESSTFTATIYFNGGTPLPDGNYRLFVCGTTSIEDLTGNPLNGGNDSSFDFTVQAPILPDTGFPRGSVTSLPAQPASMAYASSALMLEIPSLNVSAPIVGVPMVSGEWDVAWLGRSAGYLEGSAFPTWPGNTVLTAHVYGADGLPGPFVHLGALRWGDPVVIRAWGFLYVYEVRQNYLTRSTSSYPLQHEDYDWVTLLTCERYDTMFGGYAFRRVVRAVLIDVVPEGWSGTWR